LFTKYVASLVLVIAWILNMDACILGTTETEAIAEGRAAVKKMRNRILPRERGKSYFMRFEEDAMESCQD
jgi:hypothetical protein